MDFLFVARRDSFLVQRRDSKLDGRDLGKRFGLFHDGRDNFVGSGIDSEFDKFVADANALARRNGNRRAHRRAFSAFGRGRISAHQGGNYGS